jgi:hypothetical protein
LILDKILPSRVRDSYPTPLVGVPKIIVIEGVGVVKMAARALPISNSTQLLITGPADATLTVVLAHGAGAGMRSDFMNAFAEGLAAEHIRAVRFEFPYMAARQQSASKRPPDREPVLRKSWQQVIDQLAAESLCRRSGLLGLPISPDRKTSEASRRTPAVIELADVNNSGRTRSVRKSSRSRNLWSGANN